MDGKKRPTFDMDWWKKVESHLEEHPEEGFDSTEVKQFIKYCVNKRMEEMKDVDKEEIKQELLDELREELS